MLDTIFFEKNQANLVTPTKHITMKFGVPENIKKQASNYMDENILNTVFKFYQKTQAR